MTEETKQSSEMTEDEKLAQEALDETATAEGEASESEETSPAEESKQQGVPIPAHAALRKRAQTAEIGQARAEGALAAIEKQRTHDAPPSKSPLDLEIERQAAEGITEEDMTITPKVIRANDLYNQQVANQKAQAVAKEQLTAKQLTSATKAKGKHDDWQEIVLAADGLLSQGELIDIAAAGADFGEVAYAKSKAALERAKSPGTDAAPETKLSKSEAEAKVKAEAKAKAEKVPTQQEILKDINADPQTEAAALL